MRHKITELGKNRIRLVPYIFCYGNSQRTFSNNANTNTWTLEH